MKGVVSLNTVVMARYDRSVFNLAVVTQRNMRNTRKRPGHAKLPMTPAGIFLVCSALFPPLPEFSGPKLPGVGQPSLIYIFAIDYRRQTVRRLIINIDRPE